jgi:hypothetical protein
MCLPIWDNPPPQVNVAEGHKQRVILESEGLLEAKRNEADAMYTTVFRESEARSDIFSYTTWDDILTGTFPARSCRKEQAMMEATALASQVATIAASLCTSPGPEEMKLTLRTLVELRRLDQLKAIAKSGNSSTYFFGDRGQWAPPRFHVNTGGLISDVAASLGMTQDEYSVDYAERIKGGLHMGKERQGTLGPADRTVGAVVGSGTQV